MPTQQTKGTVRASKGYAVFRIIFGLLFLGLGANQYSRYPSNNQLPYFTLAIGALFVGYGLVALFSAKTLVTELSWKLRCRRRPNDWRKSPALKRAASFQIKSSKPNVRRF